MIFHNLSLVKSLGTIPIRPTVVVHRSTLDGVAIVKGVAACTIGAGANGDVTPRCAGSSRSALFSSARILTSEIYARFIIRTLVISEALPPLAAGQSVPYIPGGTGAHGPLLPGVVVARCADSIRSAWIRLAKVSWIHRNKL